MWCWRKIVLVSTDNWSWDPGCCGERDFSIKPHHCSTVCPSVALVYPEVSVPELLSRRSIEKRLWRKVNCCSGGSQNNFKEKWFSLSTISVICDNVQTVCNLTFARWERLSQHPMGRLHRRGAMDYKPRWCSAQWTRFARTISWSWKLRSICKRGTCFCYLVMSKY